MTDIVERIEAALICRPIPPELLREAADEIKQLRSQVQNLALTYRRAWREWHARQRAAAGGDLDKETIQILLDLLNPLHGSLDVQVTEQFTDERELDPPKDREYGVNVTWQMERDLTQAVMILENRRRALEQKP